MGFGKLVIETESTLVLMEEMGDAGSVELGTVDVVGKFQVECSWIEILVSTQREISLFGKFARHVDVKILCTKGVGLILQLSLECFTATFHIGIHTIANLTKAYGCGRYVLQTLAGKQLFATPMVACGVWPIIENCWQSIYSNCCVAHRQAYLYLTRLCGILGVEHHTMVIACGFCCVLFLYIRGINSC